jgi:cytochrome c-type biogenesis protein CcmH/NrfG
MDDYTASQRFMQRYINGNPQGERVSVAYFFLGEIFRLEGKFRHADMAYTTAVLLEPSLSLWWYRLGSVREAAGDYRPAAEAYEQAVRINPNYREAVDGLARSRRQAG